jgi:hypothetical protein
MSRPPLSIQDQIKGYLEQEETEGGLPAGETLRLITLLNSTVGHKSARAREYADRELDLDRDWASSAGDAVARQRVGERAKPLKNDLIREYRVSVEPLLSGRGILMTRRLNNLLDLVSDHKVPALDSLFSLLNHRPTTLRSNRVGPQLCRLLSIKLGVSDSLDRGWPMNPKMKIKILASQFDLTIPELIDLRGKLP